MIFYLAAFLFLTSCTSIEKLVEKGEYDRALEVAVKKLQGKKNKKTKHVRGLEDAFKKLNERDLAAASRLIDQDRSENWGDLFTIYSRIEARQEVIEPLLPLRSKDGYKAKFKFVRTAKLIDEAANYAAEHDYNKATKLLERGKKGDKDAAQHAYYLLNGIDIYVRNYKNTYDLMDEAEYFGQTRVEVIMKNVAPVILPAGFEREVLSINTRDLNDKWTKYYLGGSKNEEMDLQAILVIKNLDVSPEREIVTIHNNERQIKDGFEYVLDDKGNVKKDTSGNDIKVDRFISVRASVTEVNRTKSAIITGQVHFRDLHTGERFKTEHVNVVANFEDISCSFTGDKRAIDDDWRPHLGSYPSPFPTDFALTMDVAENLKYELKKKIKRII